MPQFCPTVHKTTINVKMISAIKTLHQQSSPCDPLQGKFNGIILEPLVICSDSFVTIHVAVTILPCNDMHSANYAVARCLSVCQLVCLSVTITISLKLQRSLNSGSLRLPTETICDVRYLTFTPGSSLGPCIVYVLPEPV